MKEIVRKSFFGTLAVTALVIFFQFIFGVESNVKDNVTSAVIFFAIIVCAEIVRSRFKNRNTRKPPVSE